ncbi:MAG: 50S ribosomal protein L3 [Chlamydiia bacterium]|nr:50S ribosomal protein L3 [Chlamydiia bacterium]
MTLNLMGKKRGMTTLFDEKGNRVCCTVIEVTPNVVTQVKTVEKDGYNAIQLGCDAVVTKDPRTAKERVGKPLMGHFEKNGVAPQRCLAETRVESVEGFEVGQEISVESFAEETFVDVIGTSKGRGFQGVMKRHNFAGGPASHGASKFHRKSGSTGMRSTPGRGLPGGKKPGHMGNEQVTVQNLKVYKVDAAENVIVVEGAIPGPNHRLVTIRTAKKKQKV